MTNAFRSLTNNDEVPTCDSPDQASFQTTPRRACAGPSVINRNRNDGGYFVVFRNDSTVNASLLAWTTVPDRRKRFITRSKTKRAASPRSTENQQHRRRRCSVPSGKRAERVSGSHHTDPRNQRINHQHNRTGKNHSIGNPSNAWCRRIQSFAQAPGTGLSGPCQPGT